MTAQAGQIEVEDKDVRVGCQRAGDRSRAIGGSAYDAEARVRKVSRDLALRP